MNSDKPSQDEPSQDQISALIDAVFSHGTLAHLRREAFEYGEVVHFRVPFAGEYIWCTFHLTPLVKSLLSEYSPSRAAFLLGILLVDLPRGFIWVR